jgi:hypothetical protein
VKEKNCNTKKLSDLISIGPAGLKDFKLLKISDVEQLAKQDPAELYERLSSITNSYQDPCVFDVFKAAIEQAKNPDLAPEKRSWWYWSRVRKGLIKDDK